MDREIDIYATSLGVVQAQELHPPVLPASH